MRKFKIGGFNKKEYSDIVKNMSDDELVIEFRNLPNEKNEKILKSKVNVVHTEILNRKAVNN